MTRSRWPGGRWTGLVTLDGGASEPEPGQTVVAHGLDRDLSLDEAGALRVVSSAA